jgi:hypothetical protein
VRAESYHNAMIEFLSEGSLLVQVNEFFQIKDYVTEVFPHIQRIGINAKACLMLVNECEGSLHFFFIRHS